MNFLSDLVARNLGAAAAIRPRLTSRFEPARSNLVVGHDPAVEQSVATALEETEAETMITPHEAQMNECGIHPEPRRSKPRTIIPALDDSAGNSAEQETSASPHGASQDAKRTAPLLRSRQRPATNPVGSRAASPRSPWSSSHTESSAGDRNEPEQEPDAILESPRTVWARSNLLNAETPRTHQPPLPVEEHAFGSQTPSDNLSMPRSGRKAQSGVRPAHQLLIAPAPPSNGGQRPDGLLSMRLGGSGQEPMFPTNRAKAEPEPIIEVTIGRIEIRAETTATSVRKAERADSPVMGLQEYLRRRSDRGNT